MYVRKNQINRMYESDEEHQKKLVKKQMYKEQLLKQIEEVKQRKLIEKQNLENFNKQHEKRICRQMPRQSKTGRQMSKPNNLAEKAPTDSLDKFVMSQVITPKEMPIEVNIPENRSRKWNFKEIRRVKEIWNEKSGNQHSSRLKNLQR